ncbi:MipA/OmpV family protein [Marinimicrobium sp. ABcell2]|uniref:MipA/OmpV family protein n=1 Tax=Marinimicrobium sp. ABcell2 TaxID=3069751 RepID=UPI0027AE14C9|nr:MipA/OmpV family protein [Marinimicrobium sp. ABcell2]MDQ2075732.1 MipA/OmpV family protein [Marinimicrobium sp. ABcell2]
MSAFRILILTMALSFYTAGASAEPCGHGQSHCAAVGEWELSLGIGLGVRSNPLHNGDDIPLVLIPQISYYGQRFFIENLDIGYTLVDQPNLMLNVLVTPGGDGLYFFRRGWRNFVMDGGLSGRNSLAAPASPGPQEYFGPMPVADQDERSSETPTPLVEEPLDPERTRRRRVAGMAGLEASAALGPVDWQLQLLTDVTGVHRGEELRFALSSSQYYGEHRFGVAGGFSWKSADLLEYYYGVRADEATERLPAYEPNSGVTPFVRLSWGKAVNRHWRWQGSLQYDYLSRSVRNSPLIEDSEVVQVFIGGVYHF